MNDTPSINELTEPKVNVKVWTPPAVKRRLAEMAEEQGLALSKLTASALTAYAFPALAPGHPVLKFAKPPKGPDFSGEHGPAPRFEIVEAFKAWLLVENIVASAEDAQKVVELARKHFTAGGSDDG